jgi:hypothetical protein
MKKKAIAICSVGIAVLAVSIFFFVFVNRDSAGAQRYTAEDYRYRQDQFIGLIGEENFAKFEHNHPPLNCSDAEWEKNFFDCSETWIHRIDMLEYVQPEFLQPQSQEDERPSTKTPTTPTPAPVKSGVERDHEQYASRYGVTIEEASARLDLQQAIGALNQQLLENEPSTFAGLRVEHAPLYKVIVRFTRDGQQTVSQYVQGGPLAEIIEVRPAVYSMAELKQAQAEVGEIASSLGIDHHTGISVQDNRAVLYVPDPDDVRDTLQAHNLTLPDAVSLVRMDGMQVYATVIATGG